MPTLDELRQIAERLQIHDGWPTTIDGLELVEKVYGVLVMGGDVCRSTKAIAEQMTLRHRQTGRPTQPSTADVGWALKVLQAAKGAFSGLYEAPKSTIWVPRLPTRRETPQPQQATFLGKLDEW